MTTATKIPVRFALHADGAVFCPVCGYEFVHLGPVTVQQGHTRAVCHSDRVEVTGEQEGGRGSSVEVTAWCESGHEFTYRLDFHKGTTSVELASRDFELGDEMPKELWRD